MADPDTAPQPPPHPAYVPLAEQYVIGDHPTENPDGVTVSNHDYTPKTQEEKAAMIRVPFAETSDLDPTEPAPTSDGGEGWAEKYDENFYRAHGYRRFGKEEPPENKPEPLPDDYVEGPEPLPPEGRDEENDDAAPAV